MVYPFKRQRFFNQVYARWFAVTGVFRSLLFRLADGVPSRVRFVVERLLCLLSDRRHPCFRNFDSVVSIDVIRMKSYLDSLFDPTCVSVRVTIDKLDLIP